MHTIEYTDTLQFGDETITAIQVQPLSFPAFVGIWKATSDDVRGRNVSSNAVMQRKRIVHQVHFMVGDKRVLPDAANITQLPLALAKKLVDALDIGEGSAGKIISPEAADGISAPILYQLGNPIEMTVNGKKVQLTELEFQAQVYGDIEDVLATDGDIPQAFELIRKTAVPVGVASITSLPAWALDRITVGDGVTIMRTVLPRFLE